MAECIPERYLAVTTDWTQIKCSNVR